MRRALSSIFAVSALAVAATPFWDVKPPAEWTLEEARTILTDSPWAQRLDAGPKSTAPPLQAFIATAAPVEKAENRIRAARRVSSSDPSWDEYREYLVENAGKYIVIAVSALKPEAFLDGEETRRMEEDSRLKIGKRQYRVVGSFPPSSTDPYVRLVFPREVREGDRTLTFELYVPGSGAPFRFAEFRLSDMMFRGEPSY